MSDTTDPRIAKMNLRLAFTGGVYAEHTANYYEFEACWADRETAQQIVTEEGGMHVALRKENFPWSARYTFYLPD